jgi:hypothetical protein
MRQQQRKHDQQVRWLCCTVFASDGGEARSLGRILGCVWLPAAAADTFISTSLELSEATPACLHAVLVHQPQQEVGITLAFSHF